jgi:glycosyltransferase involved in cell wall biosynthesis
MEIVVTDTGSTDRTKEIASRYADKVIDFKWVDDFSAARNFCAENASNNFIFALDCDERVTSIDISQLKKYMKIYHDKLGIVYLKNVSLQPDGKKGSISGWAERFYNKKFYCYKMQIHEQLFPKTQLPKEYVRIPIEVIHYGYAISDEEMAKKQQRNLNLLYNSLSNDSKNPYIYYQIGKSEKVLKHYNTAVEYFEKTLSLDAPCKLIYVQEAICELAITYGLLNRIGDALELMERYKDECKTVKYVYTHGIILMENNELLKALMKYIEVTTRKDADPICDEVVNSYLYIIAIYHKFGKPDLAKFFEDKYAECLKAREECL